MKIYFTLILSFVIMSCGPREKNQEKKYSSEKIETVDDSETEQLLEGGGDEESFELAPLKKRLSSTCKKLVHSTSSLAQKFRFNKCKRVSRGVYSSTDSQITPDYCKSVDNDYWKQRRALKTNNCYK